MDAPAYVSGIDASDRRLSSAAEGDVYVEEKAAERAHVHHASRCPVAKSLERAVEISTDLAFE